jgi:hypothetical protein
MEPARRSRPIPSYRRLRRKCGTDLAFIDVGGKRRYLGAYDTPESRQEYHRCVAEMQLAGDLPTPAESIIRAQVHQQIAPPSQCCTKQSRLF